MRRTEICTVVRIDEDGIWLMDKEGFMFYRGGEYNVKTGDKMAARVDIIPTKEEEFMDRDLIEKAKNYKTLIQVGLEPYEFKNGLHGVVLGQNDEDITLIVNRDGDIFHAEDCDHLEFGDIVSFEKNVKDTAEWAQKVGSIGSIR